MSQLRFPKLIGLQWDIEFTPLFDVINQESVSGFELRSGQQQYPRWQINLSYSLLPVDKVLTPTATYPDLDTLVGFYGQMGGALDDFLLNMSDLTQDIRWTNINGRQIGVGDGVNTVFYTTRNIGGYNDLIQEALNLSVYRNGVIQVSGVDYVWVAGKLTFAAPPVAGVPITFSCTALWRCRFNTSEASVSRAQGNTDPSFNNFLYKYWECKQISLVTVKL